MKYLVEAEWNPEDFDKITAKLKEIGEEMEKSPDKYPKWVFGSHIIKMGKSFSVCEADDPDQLSRVMVHYTPLVSLKFVSIRETSRVIELHEKIKK